MKAADAEAVVQSVITSYKTWLIKIFADFSVQAEQYFIKLTQDTTDPVLFSELVRAQGYFLSRQSEVIDCIATQLNILFFSQQEAVSNTSFEDLALIDDLEVERYVRRSRIVTKVLHDHRAVIKGVEARLATLEAYGAKVNPKALSPAKLYTSLETCLEKYGLTNKVFDLLYDFFNEQFSPRMFEGYELADQIMAENGVELELELTSIKSRQKFMRAPEDAKNAYLAEELMTALSRLNSNQKGMSRRSLVDGGLSTRLQEVLAEEFGSNSVTNETALSRSITSFHSRQIDFVNKVITPLVQDETIDEGVRSLFQDLVLPLTMLAIKDAELFSNPNHPGRMLVRELTLFGQGEKEGVQTCIDQVSRLVQKVCEDDANDTNLISQTADTIFQLNEKILDDFVSRTKIERAKRLRDRRLNEAKRRVVLELREQLVNQVLPDELRQGVLRILGPWMVVRYLKYGRNSAPWLESLAYMQLYFKSIQAAENITVLKRRIILRRHLVKLVRQRSESAKIPKVILEKILTAFESYVTTLSEIDQLRLLSGEESLSPEADPTEQENIELNSLQDADIPDVSMME